eukprot:scaffold122586_cov19-Prasinocladus_malaysianus.AAC.1
MTYVLHASHPHKKFRQIRQLNTPAVCVCRGERLGRWRPYHEVVALDDGRALRLGPARLQCRVERLLKILSADLRAFDTLARLIAWSYYSACVRVVIHMDLAAKEYACIQKHNNIAYNIQLLTTTEHK